MLTGPARIGGDCSGCHRRFLGVVSAVTGAVLPRHTPVFPCHSAQPGCHSLGKPFKRCAVGGHSQVFGRGKRNARRAPQETLPLLHCRNAAQAQAGPWWGVRPAWQGGFARRVFARPAKPSPFSRASYRIGFKGGIIGCCTVSPSPSCTVSPSVSGDKSGKPCAAWALPDVPFHRG